ncbi:MAG: histidinol-phosphate aminotransferase, partial [Thiotrichales bacterium]
MKHMNSIDKLIRSDLSDFKPYSSARHEAFEGKVWLNANESPWENNTNNTDACNLNRYPEQQPEELIAVLAHYYATAKDQILITRGSDEGIDLLTRLFCKPYADSILICPPTFGMYEVSGKLQAASIIKVLLVGEDFCLDIANILESLNGSLKLIFLCSPNNPTGNSLKIDDVLQICEASSGKAIVVVDEAYVEFANSKSL